MKVSILLEHSVREINLLLEEEGVEVLPDLFKHMVLAIFRKGPRNIGWFQASVQIAFESLLENDFISPNSTPSSMTLTSKGQSRNAQHAREPASKSDQFDRYWSRFI